MKDALMETVWKRREQLLREYGGMEGVLKEVARIEAERLQREKRRKAKIKKRKVSTQVTLSTPTPTPTPARSRRARTAARTSSSR